MNRENIKTVIDYVNEIRRDYPLITNDKLLDNGAIYYMNANDGTDFDWECNERLCEFMVFFKDTEMGFIKVFVNRDNTIDGYVYADGGMRGEKFEKHSINNAKELYEEMLLYADYRNKWDEDINNIFE